MRKIFFLFIVLFSFQALSQEPKEILRSIYFGGGSYYIDQNQAESLFELLINIPNIEFYDITITSHTDNIDDHL